MYFNTAHSLYSPTHCSSCLQSTASDEPRPQQSAVRGGAHYKQIMGTGFSEPSPRFGQFSALVEGKLCVWGGRTKDFYKKKSDLASSVHRFDPLQESWENNITSGPTPPGLYDGACASAGHHLYHYGGSDGSQRHGSLHQLDTRSWRWKQLSGPGGPMRKSGCGMVAYKSSLVVFGGYGAPSGPTPPGAELILSTKYTDSRGWTNELHTFDLEEGEEV